MLQLMVLGSHSLLMENKIYEDHPEEFAQFLDSTLDNFNKYYDLYLDMAKNKKFPIIFQRYEDVVKDKAKYVEETYEFMLGQEIKDTYLQKRIQDFCGSDKAGYVYKKKESSKGYEFYTEEQMKLIAEKTKNFCNFFGYNEKGDALEGIFQFHNSNQEHIKWYKENKAELDKKTLTLNDMKDENMVKPEEFGKSFAVLDVFAKNAKIKDY